MLADVDISCICSSSRLEYNSLIVGLGFWGVRDSEQKIWLYVGGW
jgi:hypothetical protein